MVRAIRCLVLALILAFLFTIPSLAEEAKQVKTAAVINFEINADDSLTQLSKGLPDMLSAKLMVQKDIKVVSRSKVKKLEINDLQDETLASKAGKDLGADMVVMGCLTDIGNGMLNLDLQIVDVSTEEITGVVNCRDSEIGQLVDTAGTRLALAIVPNSGTGGVIGQANPADAGNTQKLIDAAKASDSLKQMLSANAPFSITLKNVEYTQSDYTSYSFGGQSEEKLNAKERAVVAREFLGKLLVDSNLAYDGEYITFKPGSPIEGLPKSGLAAKVQKEDAREGRFFIKEEIQAGLAMSTIEIDGTFSDGLSIEFRVKAEMVVIGGASYGMKSYTAEGTAVTEKVQ